MIHKIDREPIKKTVMHIDFHAVSLTDPVDVEVPLHLHGVAEVEKKGAIIQHALKKIAVRILPANVPEHIRVEIAQMEIGDTLRVKDITLPDKCELKTDPEELIVSVLAPKKEAEPQTTEAKEPELVGEAQKAAKAEAEAAEAEVAASEKAGEKEE